METGLELTEGVIAGPATSPLIEPNVRISRGRLSGFVWSPRFKLPATAGRDGFPAARPLVNVAASRAIPAHRRTRVASRHPPAQDLVAAGAEHGGGSGTVWLHGGLGNRPAPFSVPPAHPQPLKEAGRTCGTRGAG
jgi:hypothetical protein